MKYVKRQSLSNRFVHWTSAFSIFWLIVTGIGQLPFYRRYFVTDIPGLAFLGDYFTMLTQHYIAATLLVGVAVYHVTYHLMMGEREILPKRGDFRRSLEVISAMLSGKSEPPSEKYLPEQRLAYAFIAMSIVVLVASGLVKSWKNLMGNELSDAWLFWAATFHNTGMVWLILGIIGHLAAFLFKPNRKLLRGMVYGDVEAQYVLERHGLWEEGTKEAREILKEDLPKR